MIKIIYILLIPFFIFSQVSWDQVIDTHAEHVANIDMGNHPHFDTTWYSSGGINDLGYFRWTISTGEEEDDDGYTFDHPLTTTNQVYIGFGMRVGSTYLNHCANENPTNKMIMFYNSAANNPRPTIFQEGEATGVSGTYTSFGADVAAGGNGTDEFGEASIATNYPNHTFKIIEDTAHSQWYFVCVGIDSGDVRVRIWSQDSTLTGGAQGNPDYCSMSGLDTSQEWRWNRLLAYMETTSTGDANSYIDICYIVNSQSWVEPPNGFFTGEAEATVSQIISGSGKIRAGNGKAY